MQQTKRRSKKGVILLALVVALLVLAFVPAAMATVYGAKATLDSTSPTWVAGQNGGNWVNGHYTITGYFEAYVDLTGGPIWTPATDGGNQLQKVRYWVNGGTSTWLPWTTNTPMVSGTLYLDEGANTVSSAVESTSTVTEPTTNTMLYSDSHDPVWAWTLSPADPGGVTDSPANAGWYGNVSVNFTGTASDPNGSGIDTARADWTNIDTSTASFNIGVPTGANPWVQEVTGTITPPKLTDPASVLASTTTTLTADDMVDNVGEKAFTVHFDVWAPDTNASVSPAGADTFAGYTKGPVTITFAAHDNGGAGVDYTEYINQVTSGTAVPAAPALTASGTKTAGQTAALNTDTITATAPVGPTYVWYRSVDKAVPANKEVWHLVKIFIDNQAPTVTNDAPTWWVNAGFNDRQIGGNKLGATSGWEYWYVTLNAKDPNSGVASVSFKMPSWIDSFSSGLYYPYADWKVVPGATAKINLNVNVISHVTDGIFPYTYHATDGVGNVSADATGTVYIDTRDPVTTGDSGWVNGTVPFNLTATDQATGAGVAATIYRVDQSTPWLQNVAAKPATTFDTPITLTGGQGSVHTIDFGSVDAALPADFPLATWDAALMGPTWQYGNSEFTTWTWGGSWRNITGYKSLTVKLDVTPPTVSASDPKNGNWQTGPATINFSGSDVGSGYATTQWSTDGGTTWHNGDTASIGGNGVITVTYHGVDKVGLKSADQTIQVKVASTGPSVTGGNVSVKKGHRATFAFNVTSVTPTATVSIQIRTKSGQTLSTHNYANVTTGAAQTRAFAVNLKKGKYNIRISAVDEAGNVQTRRGAGTLTVK